MNLVFAGEQEAIVEVHTKKITDMQAPGARRRFEGALVDGAELEFWVSVCERAGGDAGLRLLGWEVASSEVT
eukprot:6202738-Pleurochrysis_carterae.AAC.1